MSKNRQLLFVVDSSLFKMVRITNVFKLLSRLLLDLAVFNYLFILSRLCLDLVKFKHVWLKVGIFRLCPFQNSPHMK